MKADMTADIIPLVFPKQAAQHIFQQSDHLFMPVYVHFFLRIRFSARICRLRMLLFLLHPALADFADYPDNPQYVIDMFMGHENFVNIRTAVSGLF